MKGAFFIFICMVAVGIVLYLADVLYYRKKYPSGDDAESGSKESAGEDVAQEESRAKADDSQCCGMHLVCEKTSLSPVSDEIVYYDDEELDRFQGRADDEYYPEEIEEFRDVLLTLMPSDVAGWARSIQLRRISLPKDVREELLMIVSEQRANQSAS